MTLNLASVPVAVAALLSAGLLGGAVLALALGLAAGMVLQTLVLAGWARVPPWLY
jgi:hypothetical protein